MKKILFGTALSAALLLAACGGDTEETESDMNTSSEETETTESEESTEETETTDETESEDSANNEGSRSNPLSLGETAEIQVLTYSDEGEDLTGTANITVDNVLRGEEALSAMEDEYMGYEAYEDENYEWVVFDLTFELTEFTDPDTAFFAGDNIEIYSTEGSPAPNEFATIPNEFMPGELYEGGSITGKVARPAPKDESFLIQYNDGVSDTAFFEVQ